MVLAACARNSNIDAVIDMATRYVLIDYENVQPEKLERLNANLYAVLVFVGASQAKMPTNLVTAMQRFVRGFRCIQVSGNGRDALDFHIAYYLGRIAAAEPDASFYIVSGDSGYDPLIRHLEEAKIAARRIASIDDISGKRPMNVRPVAHDTAAAPDRLAEIIDDLKRRGDSKPRTVKAFRATINARYQKQLTERDLSALVDQLTKRGAVTVQGTKVSYRLPA